MATRNERNRTRRACNDVRKFTRFWVEKGTIKILPKAEFDKEGKAIIPDVDFLDDSTLDAYKAVLLAMEYECIRSMKQQITYHMGGHGKITYYSQSYIHAEADKMVKTLDKLMEEGQKTMKESANVDIDAEKFKILRDWKPQAKLE